MGKYIKFTKQFQVPLFFTPAIKSNYFLFEDGYFF